HHAGHDRLQDSGEGDRQLGGGRPRVQPGLHHQGREDFAEVTGSCTNAASAAGSSGRAKRNPCAQSQPSSRKSESCSFVSTPSAVTLVFTARARSKIARTISFI